MTAPVAKPPEDTAALLAKLGVVDQNTIAKTTFARVLLLAPSKVGKTTAIAGTAPSPFVINCDEAASALKGATNTYGDKAKFMTFSVPAKGVKAKWREAVKVAKELVSKGIVRTVSVDTLLMLQDSLLRELSVTLDGFDLWREVEKELMGGIKELCALPCHVFLVSHITPSKEDFAAGVLPGIQGSAKLKIPAMIDDWILLDINLDGAEPKRRFVVGPQKTWSANGRNIKRSTTTEPTIPALFEELGIPM
jgi:hypothetical protein